ncbi:hypothetical protein WH52_14695, partial [Tenacibaculum holothuriorum]
YNAQGCSDTVVTTINPFNGLSNAVVAQVSDLTCVSGEEIRVTFDSSIAASPITADVRVTGPGGYDVTLNGTSPLNFTGLGEGVYTVAISNADPTINCVLTETYEVLPVTNYILDVTKTSDIVCLGDITGAITFDFNAATDYSGAYTYVIKQDGGTPNDFTDDTDVTGSTGADGSGMELESVGGIPAGTGYYVEVTMTATPECLVRSGFFTIDAPAVALSVTGATTAISC